MKAAIDAWQKPLKTQDGNDDTPFVLMQNVIEQACNHFLRTGTFLQTYEEMQGLPVLSVGMLTYAGDDGGAKGQAYRFALDETGTAVCLRFRFPDAMGRWQWREEAIPIPLPACVVPRLTENEGALLAPTLRELVHAHGEPIAVLDLSVRVPKQSLADW